MPCELTRVDLCNGHCVLLHQILGQILNRAKVGGLQGQVFDDQARSLNFFRLYVLCVDPVAANVGIGKGDQLTAVAGVSQNFLVTRHRGVEHHLSHCQAWCANRNALKNCTVCKRQNGGGTCSLKRQKHWVLQIMVDTPTHPQESSSAS